MHSLDGRKAAGRSNLSVLPAALFYGAMALAISTAAAQSSDQNTQGVAAVPKTAFFYEDPQILNSELHAELRITVPQNAGFAADAQVVPVLLSEFGDVALEYPIVFVKTTDASWLALALTGLEPGRNVFVDAAGNWGANYVPASVRRYPFVLASGEAGSLAVAVDMALASEEDSALPLFDGAGNPAPVLQNAIGFLQSFQGQSQQTSALIARLDELELLIEAQFQIRDQDGGERNVNGFFIVEEARLNTLRDDTILDMFRKGQMSVVQTHLLSLKNIAALQRREAAAQSE